MPDKPKDDFADLEPNQVDELMKAILKACPQVGDKNQGQDAVGAALNFAAKWYGDLDKAFSADQVGPLIPAEVMAYGALNVLFTGLPADDIRRQLFTAGGEIGKFIRQRWEDNARQEAFRQTNPS